MSSASGGRCGPFVGKAIRDTCGTEGTHDAPRRNGMKALRRCLVIAGLVAVAAAPAAL